MDDQELVILKLIDFYYKLLTKKIKQMRFQIYVLEIVVAVRHLRKKLRSVLPHQQLVTAIRVLAMRLRCVGSKHVDENLQKYVLLTVNIIYVILQVDALVVVKRVDYHKIKVLLSV